jgi:hypothetical protein
MPAESAARPPARPEQVARAALREIGLRQREPVGVGGHQRKPRPRLVGSAASPAHRKADPRPAAPPHPAAQLVQLRDAEAIRLLDDHDGRVRHVDAQLDDGGRHQHVQARRRERAQRLLLRVGGQRAVQQADARGAELAQQARVLRDGGDRVIARGRLAHRADDERLPPSAIASRSGRRRRAVRRRPTHTPPRRRAARGRSVRNDASRSPCSASARLRGIGVADIDSRCGTPRAAPARERGAHGDAEAVLLVDDRQPEARQPRRRVQQRLRPDQQRDAPGGRALEQRRARRAVVAPVSARSPARGAPPPAAARAPAARRAPRSAPSSGLPARRRDQRRRAQRDRGLAAADVAHQQALHRRRPARSAAIVVERAPLRRGQREPERRLEPRAHAAAAAAGTAAPPRPPPPAAAGRRPA